jgi:hypothetical protein
MVIAYAVSKFETPTTMSSGARPLISEISTTGMPLLISSARAASVCTKLCRIIPEGRQPSSVLTEFSSSSGVNSPCTSSIE